MVSTHTTLHVRLSISRDLDKDRDSIDLNNWSMFLTTFVLDRVAEPTTITIFHPLQ